ncbi:hypothetical protein ERUR111494_04690 [Erysipelothrix urinaevulpis]|uniref:hypothetical protein n=1 Tax=Erysipelothrix urinaevulpis TaxID=2683717 RepID=UPI001356E720|nr:hypothetical protein [Erysipelothrix urinaevulpis]
MELFLMLLETTIYIFSLYFFYYFSRNKNFSRTRYVFIIYRLIAVLLIIKDQYNYGFSFIELCSDIVYYEIVILIPYFCLYKTDIKYSKFLNTVNNLQINYIILSSLDKWEMNAINDLSKTLEIIDSYFKIQKKYKTLGRIYLDETENYFIIEVLISGEENEPFPADFGSVEVSVEPLGAGKEYSFRHEI